MALPEAPMSRNETYMAKIAGQAVTLPEEPLSRAEQYLDYIAKHGSGGGGGDIPRPATEDTIGGVIVGNGLDVDADGKVSVKCASDSEVTDMLDEIFS